MTKLTRAEAVLVPDLECTPETLAAAKLAGLLAAKKAGEMAPFGPSARPTKVEVEIAVAEEEIRVAVAVEAETGAEAAALFAATAAAQTLADLAHASIQSVRPTGQTKESATATPYPRKPVAAVPVRARPTPTTLTGEAIGPKPPAAHVDRREAFRTFMSGNHLHITEWCQQAGIPVGIVYSFLTGRSVSIPSDAAERLAAAAGVKVEDMFQA
jgi:hypothetical protein